MDVAGQVALRFTGGAHSGSHLNLTAVRADGHHLWVAGDDTATLERLVLDSATAPTRAGRQRTFRLADLVQLPGPANGDSDIEGIASGGGWLWVIGSHALVRRRPKPGHDETKTLRRLGKLRRDPNRYVIARLAVQLGVDRRPEPVRVSRDGRRSALVGAPGAESLVDLLHADAHLGPFVAIPALDNGFDVQGIAAVGERLFLGLRGPVLRGWAVVLEVLPVQDPTDPGRLALGIFPEGGRYRKHFLDLGGLGVRDLCPDGDDLLVLAGPTMTLSGEVRVHRWLGATVAALGPLVRDVDLPVQTVVPHGPSGDNPEGMTLLADDRRDPAARLLVVYDAPVTDRCPWPDTVLADRIWFGSEPAAPDEPEPAAAEEPAVDTAVPEPAEPEPAEPPTAEPPTAEPPAAEPELSTDGDTAPPTTEPSTTETPVAEAHPDGRSPARRSPARRSPTRRSPTRRSPSRRSPDGQAPPAGSTAAETPTAGSTDAGSTAAEAPTAASTDVPGAETTESASPDGEHPADTNGSGHLAARLLHTPTRPPGDDQAN